MLLNQQIGNSGQRRSLTRPEPPPASGGSVMPVPRFINPSMVSGEILVRPDSLSPAASNVLANTLMFLSASGTLVNTFSRTIFAALLVIRAFSLRAAGVVTQTLSP